MRIACFPSQSNASGSEVNIFGMIFIVQTRGEQSHYVHARATAVFREVLDERIAEAGVRHKFHKLGNDMPKPVHLPLPRDMSSDAA